MGRGTGVDVLVARRRAGGFRLGYSVLVERERKSSKRAGIVVGFFSLASLRSKELLLLLPV